MDFGLYVRVLWRFRALVAAGLAISAALAFLSYARVELDGGLPSVSHRTSLTWTSESTILITERGFPWGAASLQDLEAVQRGEEPRGPQYNDPGRFTSLALIYARLARSDEVRSLVARKGAPPGASYAVTPEYQEGIGFLPIVSISAWSASPDDARRLAGIVTDAFRSYVAEQQQSAGIPADRRVRLDVLRSAKPATVMSGRSKVKPVLILLLGLAGTFGLAFVLENLRPRVRHTETTTRWALRQLPAQRPERSEAEPARHTG